jgi:hypothetical protein
LPKFLPGHDFAGSLQQHDQQAKGKILQLYADSITRKGAPFGVQFEGAEAIDRHFWQRARRSLPRRRKPLNLFSHSKQLMERCK